MWIDPKSGLLSAARHIASPNCDDRPVDAIVELIVIHGISLPPGEFGGPWIDAFFCNRLNPQAHPFFKEIETLHVSTHLLIRRDGELVQYVPFQRRAWHAGKSSFAGRAHCNDYSIGIELEGADEIPYTDCQYEQLIDVILALRAAFPRITPERIVGHADIAPGRKTDPGPAFDWPRLRAFTAAAIPNQRFF